MRFASALLIAIGCVLLICRPGFAGTTGRSSALAAADILVAEALANNPEIKAARAKVLAMRYKVPQAGSLPDPMVIVGYQNVGLNRYTYGNANDAQWSAGIQQMIPFPGKLSAKESMAAREAETALADYELLRLKTAERVRELVAELGLAHRTLDILADKEKLFAAVEKAALARYASGMGTQAEAVMAQGEKYMLLERTEMARQKLQTAQAMLAQVLGRGGTQDIGRPEAFEAKPYGRGLDDLMSLALANSREVAAKERMIDAAQAKVLMAKREFLPDLTFNLGYGNKGFPMSNQSLEFAGGSFPGGEYKQFEDMWSVGVGVTVPLYFWSKQSMGLKEAQSSLDQARHERDAARLMVQALVRENFLMLATSERVAELASKGLIPKNRQEFDLALAAYAGGRAESQAVIAKLRGLLDAELSRAENLANRDKAAARLERLAGIGPAEDVTLGREAAPGKQSSRPQSATDERSRP